MEVNSTFNDKQRNELLNWLNKNNPYERNSGNILQSLKSKLVGKKFYYDEEFGIFRNGREKWGIDGYIETKISPFVVYLIKTGLIQTNIRSIDNNEKLKTIVKNQMKKIYPEAKVSIKKDRHSGHAYGSFTCTIDVSKMNSKEFDTIKLPNLFTELKHGWDLGDKFEYTNLIPHIEIRFKLPENHELRKQSTLANTIFQPI